MRARRAGLLAGALHYINKKMEPKLWGILLTILDLDLLPSVSPNFAGYVLDAGANDGATARMLARAFGPRELRVLAIEPLLPNARAIERMCLREPKVGAVVESMRAGLGAVNGTVGHYPRSMDEGQGRIQLQINSWDSGRNRGESSYPILTVDDLFLDGTGKQLVFAHLDMEGSEHLALRGAMVTLARDRPIVAIETYEEFLPAVFNETRAVFEHLSYRTFVVDEHVGGIKDGRNAIAVPRERAKLVQLLVKVTGVTPSYRRTGAW